MTFSFSWNAIYAELEACGLKAKGYRQFYVRNYFRFFDAVRLVCTQAVYKTSFSKGESDALAEEPSDVMNDAALVESAQQGDPSAFDDLIRKYHTRLYGLIYHMTSNHEDTNDLLQEVFSKAYRSIHSFRGNSSFYTWIYRIAVNMTLNFLKKKRRVYHSSLDDEDNHLENDADYIAATSGKDPRHLLSNKELQKKLDNAMQQLSSHHRAVVTLFDIQGIPQSEIAAILKTTEGTVRSRLFYAHRQLQTYLKEFMTA